MYTCQNLFNYKKGQPSYKGHYMWESKVDAAVYAVIRDQIKGCLDSEALIQELNRQAEGIYSYDVFVRKVAKTRAELRLVTERKADLFADYSQGLIDVEQYMQYTEECSIKLENLKNKLEENLMMQAKYSKSFAVNKDWKAVVEKYKSKRSLSKEMIDAFVDKVIIWDKKNVEVHLKYDDLYRELLALCEERKVG